MTVLDGNMYCDNCNPNWDPENSGKYPEELAKLGGFSPNEQAFRGTRNSEELGDCWEEREYGHICPVCIYTEKMDDLLGVTEAFDRSIAVKFGLVPPDSEDGVIVTRKL
jgi:hypothetical protein